MELHSCFWNCMQAHYNACNLLELHATLGNLEQPKECIQTEFNCIKFWNILEHSGTLYVVEGCKMVDFQVDHTHTDRQTHTQTLGLVKLRLRS